jgi:DNA replication and repair protein RecF
MLPVVVFEPAHMQLLTDAPNLRRDFFDDIIEKIKPAFGSTRRQYKRALSQRNTLLKQNQLGNQLFIWDVRLSELGGRIIKERQEFINDSQIKLTKLYNKLSNKRHKTQLIYKTKTSGADFSSGLLKALQESTKVDKELGFTTHGPHRDDIVPMLGGYELVGHGSRGEVRTMLLTLKLLELMAVEAANEIKPILLLDDVFSELDGARRLALTDYLKDRQTFITTTDADVVLQHFIGNSSIIPMQAK